MELHQIVFGLFAWPVELGVGAVIFYNDEQEEAKNYFCILTGVDPKIWHDINSTTYSGNYSRRIRSRQPTEPGPRRM
jgi:hypothetical protein